MNLGKILGAVAKVAVPVAAGAVAGPEVGGAFAVAMGSGALGKAAGKKIEERTGIRAQKTLAPIAAMAGGAGVVAAVPEVMETICSVVQAVCENPALLGLVPGLGAIIGYTTVQNIQKTSRITQ